MQQILNYNQWAFTEWTAYIIHSFNDCTINYFSENHFEIGCVGDIVPTEQDSQPRPRISLTVTSISHIQRNTLG